MRKSFQISEAFAETVDGGGRVTFHTLSKGKKNCTLVVYHAGAEEALGLAVAGASAMSGIRAELFPATVSPEAAELFKAHCSEPYVSVWEEHTRKYRGIVFQALLAHEFQHVLDMRAGLIQRRSTQTNELVADMAAVIHAGYDASIQLLEGAVEHFQGTGQYVAKDSLLQWRLDVMRQGYATMVARGVLELVKKFFSFGGQK